MRAHGRLEIVLFPEVQLHVHAGRPQRVHDHARLLWNCLL